MCRSGAGREWRCARWRGGRRRSCWCRSWRRSPTSSIPTSSFLWAGSRNLSLLNKLCWGSLSLSLGSLKNWEAQSDVTITLEKECDEKIIKYFGFASKGSTIRNHTLTYGSGSGSVRQWLSRCQQKIIFFSEFFGFLLLKVHLQKSWKIKSLKKVAKQ